MKAIAQVYEIDKKIQRALKNINDSNRGEKAQDILLVTRHLLDAIAVIIKNNNFEGFANWVEIEPAEKDLHNAKGAQKIKEFYNLLQGICFHNILDIDNSEHIINKYISYYIEIRNYIKNKFGFEILKDIERLMSKHHGDLENYYRSIKARLDIDNHSSITSAYYIMSQTPVIIDNDVIYEISLSITKRKSNKQGNIIAFSKERIPFEYRAKFFLQRDEIEISEQIMPIYKIIDYTFAIKPQEINKIGAILKITKKIKSNYKEYTNLMHLIYEEQINLLDIAVAPKDIFERCIIRINISSNTGVLDEILRAARSIILGNSPGCNVLRYLLYTLSKEILDSQYVPESNSLLSDLHLRKGCIPFETMPFCTSLIQHNPDIDSLFTAIPCINRQHELLVRKLKTLSDSRKQIFHTFEDFASFGDEVTIRELVKSYNRSLINNHELRQICILEPKFVFLREHALRTYQIIKSFKSLCLRGAERYASLHAIWKKNFPFTIDSQEKKEILESLFISSQVAIINGAAGTGKTSLINYVSEVYASKTKIFLAYTHPAVENIKNRVRDASDETCMTISRFITKGQTLTTDLLVIDECSIVPAREMYNLLQLIKAEAVMLIGDPQQLSSISFGNWFQIIGAFLPKDSIKILKDNHRTASDDLKDLWKSVRELSGNISEMIARGYFSANLNRNIFKREHDDEIILALNYNGVFGINNINSYFQRKNPSTPYSFGANEYKAGDPIIFKDNSRFKPILHNNLKGKIVEITPARNGLFFILQVEKVINKREAETCGLTLYDNEDPNALNSTIGFIVNFESADTDSEENDELYTVPFQVAYAVSIHKSQGLEYESVKIVITDTIEDHISHDVFYTAITRAKSHLKIFWNPLVEQKIVASFKKQNFGRDINLMKNIFDKKAKITK